MIMPLEDIAKVLNVPLQWILTGSRSAPPTLRLIQGGKAKPPEKPERPA